MSGWQPCIGLEVHVQLQLATKLFSPAPYARGGAANTRVSWYDLGLPGQLPQLNDAAVDLAIRAGLALGGEIAPRCEFDRKSYFYPDLPKGHQITQELRPLVRGGSVDLGAGRELPLRRIHLEEDAGKTMHRGSHSLVDLNRAGAALIEIVSEPALHSPREAETFLRNLRQIMRHAGVSACEMEQGSLRCDANISLRPTGSTALGTRVEVKNLNSFRHLRRALEYEVQRQTGILEAGHELRSETRLWQDAENRTQSMRAKEDAAEYRYLPDPDLPPLPIHAARIAAAKAALPELPAALRQRFGSEYQLPAGEVEILLEDPELARYFEATASRSGLPRLAARWVLTEILRHLRRDQRPITACPIPPDGLAELLQLLDAEALSHAAAVKVCAAMWERGLPAEELLDELGLRQLSDPAALQPILEQVLRGMPDAVDAYRNGEEQALHAILGGVMRTSRGRANPRLVSQRLREILRKEPE